MRAHAGKLRIAGAIVSGLMAAALVPPVNWAALVWLVMIPLLIALWSLPEKRAGWKGFGLGWLAGAVGFGLQLQWLAVVSTFGAVILPLYLGLFWGAFGAIAATWGNPWRGREADEKAAAPTRRERMLAVEPVRQPSPIRRSLLTAFCLGSVFAALEWLRGWLLTGFGWNGLGVAFHETLAMAQAADLLGVAGLSLVVVFFQAVLVQAARRMAATAGDGKRRPRWDFGIAALTVGLLLSYGIIRLAQDGQGESIRLKSLLVQINIPQDAAVQLWDALDVHLAYEEDTLAALEAIKEEDAKRLEAAMEASSEGGISLNWPDWVIWPESALTGRILRTDGGGWGTWQNNLDTIARVRQAGPFSLIYGINELEAVAEGDSLLKKPDGRAYNSLAVMTPADELETFRKHHLVIFGETIPFVDTIPFLKKLYQMQAGVEYGGSFSPGTSFEPLPAMIGGREVGIIPSVCFEDTVPRLKRRFLRPGPQIIVNVTNDGWFDQSAAAAQHFANARFRAIELRRPMIRCANTGVTAAISAAGSTAHPDTGKSQILTDDKGSHFTRGTLLTELDIPENPAFSLYALIGDWGIITLGILGLGTLFATRPRQKTA